jgi:hypothetical protein
VLAGLSRETMLLVPVVLGLHLVWRRALGRRELAILVAAPLAYVGWTIVVRGLTGFGLSQRRTLAPPFRGLLDVVGHWGAVDFLALLLLVVLAAAAAWRDRLAVETSIAAAFLAFGTVMSLVVWGRWQDFGRVLIPAAAFAVIVLLPGSAPPPVASGDVGSLTPAGAPGPR